MNKNNNKPIKCDFCTKCKPNGKCFYETQFARESYCKEAINNMIKVFQTKKGV